MVSAEKIKVKIIYFVNRKIMMKTVKHNLSEEKEILS